MAQNLEQTNKISSQREKHHQIGDSIESQDLVVSQKKKAIITLAKPSSKDKDSKSRLERLKPQRASGSIANHQITEDINQVSSQRYQPSKPFAQKCLIELQSILELIKVDYHEEIKNLYVGKDSHQYTDLCIRVGEKFEKSIHKCIIASRAYKFYCALKLYRNSAEELMIVSGTGAHKTEDEGPKDTSGEISSEEFIAKQLKERQLKEALEFFECTIPENLVDPELLQNFVRRVYSDQDLFAEETHLNKQLVNWLKENRPEFVQINQSKTKISLPDHRESFRTIKPDFEQLSLTERTNSPVNTDSSTTTDLVIERSVSKMNQQESIDGSSQVASLTRTETFELISKTDNSSTGSTGPTGASSNRSATDNLTDDDESRKQATNDSESSDAYAPTTRTGLKPKKFTTPVGIKSTPRSKPATTISPSGDKTTPSSKIGSTNRAGNAAKSTPTHRKSCGTGTCLDTSPSLKTSTTTTIAASKPKTSTPYKSKPTVITRAHPISLEQSHSPANTSAATRGRPKDFIAVNKRLVSQMEKKLASAMSAAASNLSQNEQAAKAPVGNYDSENETSDTSFMAIEPLTTDNLAAQLDKFTLASCSKLAEALSRMFIGEILTDTIILTSGGNKQIRAHRCILAARSAFLNDVIKRQDLPSATPDAVEGKHLQPLKIDLSEFSYSAVYFSIIHMYSGIVRVPEDLDSEELSKLSHLLHVGTLRQVCVHNLRMKYCHYFHKPCSICCIGVLKALPLAWRYDYTELYSQCLQWIGTHFAQIFCLEEFSNLKPQDLIEECYKATLSQLTPDNVIQRTVECQKLLKSLPGGVKWNDSIICLVGRQLEGFCHYVADNYEKILQSESFLSLGRSCWECEVLEENLLAAMNHLKPDSGCKTLIQLDKIRCSIEPFSGGFSADESGSISGRNVSESFASLVAKMSKYCERYLLKEAVAVVHCSSWRQMHPSLQKRIKDQALLSTDFDEPTKNLASKPKLHSIARQQGSRLSPSSPQPRTPSGAMSPSNKTTSDSSSKLNSPNSTYLPPPKNKPAAARHVKVLK